ncbi:VOC family protein [Paludisphaera soli]|uniref:VOC family protein n=1 Tax=Paludisphaera soli TaxID=2712865 RepID=UPI0013EDA502|nr:VOC family protein [Paludisphaera soli]
MTQLQAVHPISNEDVNALPVQDLGPAIDFYERTLGFTLAARDDSTARLTRDDVQIGLVRKQDHDPGQAGSCAFDVRDLDALHAELEGKGGELGSIGTAQWDGKRYRVFFLREDEDGYCFCFSQPA